MQKVYVLYGYNLDSIMFETSLKLLILENDILTDWNGNATTTPRISHLRAT